MRRSLTSLVALLAVALTAAACGGSGDPATGSAPGPDTGDTTASCGATVDEIAAAAMPEGQVDLIALPGTWVNYEGILASFESRYGIAARVGDADAASADQLDAIEKLRGEPGMPEVVDVNRSFTAQMIDRGFAANYRPTVWDEIPGSLKDPDGRWVAAYYGALAIASNTALVPNPPRTWADLTRPGYRGQVSLSGDPRESGAAFAAVMAASLANGGSFDDILPGITYMAGLKRSGNLQDTDVTETSVLSGDAPIALDWTYNFPALREAGASMRVVVPSDGVYGDAFAQSVVTGARHPCAARLFLEHLVGDDGALGYLEGGAIPARYAALAAAGKLPADVTRDLPPAAAMAKVAFPTQAQIDAAKQVLADNWGPMVADL